MNFRDKCVIRIMFMIAKMIAGNSPYAPDLEKTENMVLHGEFAHQVFGGKLQ